jgi:hypothetical protein
MVACVIEVEVCTNEDMDIARCEAKHCQLLKHIAPLSRLYGRTAKLRMWWTNMLSSTACIDQNIDATVGLNKVAWYRDVSWLHRGQVHKKKTSW